MGEVHIRLVENDNLPSPHARAEFPSSSVVVLSSSIHNGELGQEGLQIEPTIWDCFDKTDRENGSFS
jgi:hypothetical protein